MDFKKSYFIYAVSVGIFIFLLALCMLLKIYILGIIGLILLLIGVIQTKIFYICPHCGKYLNIKVKKPTYCPHCGEALY